MGRSYNMWKQATRGEVAEVLAAVQRLRESAAGRTLGMIRAALRRPCVPASIVSARQRRASSGSGAYPAARSRCYSLTR